MNGKGRESEMLDIQRYYAKLANHESFTEDETVALLTSAEVIVSRAR